MILYSSSEPYKITQLRIQKEDFFTYRSVNVLPLSRVASEAIRLSMLFRSGWLCETSFSALLGRKNEAKKKTNVEQDLWYALTARARQNKMQHKSYHSVILWVLNLFNKLFANPVDCFR